MSDKLIVNWDEYNNTVEKLAIQIEESGYKPTILIGIMRGAAPMIDVLSRINEIETNVRNKLVITEKYNSYLKS